jgi:hypothetical protein
MPATSSADDARTAVTALIHALESRAPASLFPNPGDAQMAALNELAIIFQTASPRQPPASPRVPLPPPSPRLWNPSACLRVPTLSPAPTSHRSTSAPNTGPTKWPHHTISQTSTGQTGSSTSSPVKSKNSVNSSKEPTNLYGPNHLPINLDASPKTPAFACPPTPKPFSSSPKTRFPNSKVTYGCIITVIRPQKNETYRTHLTGSGDRLGYPGAFSMPTAKLTTAKKCLLNSTISTPHDHFMGVDI